MTNLHLVTVLSLFTQQFYFGYSDHGYDFVFTPSADLAPRALLTTRDGQFIQHLDTDRLTICFLAYIESHPRLAVVDLISYSSVQAGQYNEILLYVNYPKKSTAIHINGQRKTFDYIPTLNEWSHICLLWTSEDGQVLLNVNGDIQGVAYGLKKGYTIGRKGYLILGQDQDEYNGGFAPDHGIRGRLTNFNMWNRVLSTEEVEQAGSCSLHGNMVNWRNATWAFHDAIQMQLSTAPCATKTCEELQSEDDFQNKADGDMTTQVVNDVTSEATAVYVANEAPSEE